MVTFRLGACLLVILNQELLLIRQLRLDVLVAIRCAVRSYHAVDIVRSRRLLHLNKCMGRRCAVEDSSQKSFADGRGDPCADSIAHLLELLVRRSQQDVSVREALHPRIFPR